MVCLSSTVKYILSKTHKKLTEVTCLGEVEGKRVQNSTSLERSLQREGYLLAVVSIVQASLYL